MNTLVALMLAITAAITGQTATKEPMQHKEYVKEYSITVNKATNCVTIYQKTTTGSFEPVKAMICSVGEGTEDNITPSGTYHTGEKYTWRALFGDVYGQYATRIDGPILFHSVYYDAIDASTLRTEEYNRLGSAASAGCIRLTTADAKWIYDNCPTGTVVNIIDTGTDPLPRPEAIKLGSNAPYPNWDPTDPNPNNPWINETVEIIPKEDKLVIYASDALTDMELTQILQGAVTVYDTANNIITPEISCNANTAIPGIYSVRYYAGDCLGNEDTLHTTITVK